MTSAEDERRRLALGSVPPALVHRNPGDAWVHGPNGESYWGRFGAAGLLAHDPARDAVLLQHRAAWSHQGGTWGIPGGALHEGEDVASGALREAAEEAGVPAGAVTPTATYVLDRGVWRYTTVLGPVTDQFDPRPTDAESIEVAWVAVEDVEGRPLHPGFAAAWPALRAMLEVRASLLVDAANVVGSVPDGWWRDRAGAAERLGGRLEALTRAGVPAALMGLGGAAWFPETVVMLEGRARAAGLPDAVVRLEAPASGDDALVAEAAARTARGEHVTAVTSDRALRVRLEEAGARVVGAGALLEVLASLEAEAG